MNMLKRVIFLSVCLAYFTEGSKIEFYGTPTDVKDGLTANFTLRCGLKDTSSSIVIVGKRDVTHTTSDVAEVMSLVVTKDGKDVAFVSHSALARVMNGSGNIRVTGSTAVTSGERGFLELTIEDPSKSQTGEFVCVVNAMDHTGHVVTFSSSVEIKSVAPTTADLIQYVRDVNRDKENMKLAMEATIADVRSELNQLKNKTETVVLFGAGLTKSTYIPTGQTVVYDKVFLNVGAGYNSATGVFTCSVPGYYQFVASSLSNQDATVGLAVYHNAESVVHIYSSAGFDSQSQSNTMMIKLAQNDSVQIKTYTDTSVWGSPTDVHTTFTGFLVASD